MNTHMTASWERITPPIAETFLRKVHPRQKGRNVLSVIETYARQMAAGTWDENVAQTISIGSDGALIDGWHRLNAVIKANRAVRFLVVRGVDPDAYANYDAGNRRTVAFRMGVDKDTSSVIACLRVIALYGLSSSPITREEFETVADFALKDIERFNSMTTPTRVAHITAAPVRAAAILQMKVNPEKAEAICNAYTNLVKMDFHEAPRSMTALYKRLTDEHSPQLMRFALAWRAFCPSRFSNIKLQIKDLTAVIGEVRDGPLKELTGAIRTEEVVTGKRLTSIQYAKHARQRKREEARA